MKAPTPSRSLLPAWLPDRPLAAFLAILAALALALSRVAFTETHWDEDACAAIAWLLSRGWKLYGDVFSHHMPLDYLPGWALAKLFGYSHGLFRGFMLALWASVCLALFQMLRRRGAGKFPLAALLFALLTSQWLTYWRGQMMLVESYWGYAVVLLLALTGSPLGLRDFKAARPEAVAAGALLGLILCASPVCAPAALCFAAWLARDPHWRPRWKELGAGLALWLAVFLLWCLGHVDMGKWYGSVFTFNSAVYSGFYGFTGPHPLAAFAGKVLRDNFLYFSGALAWNNFEQYFEGLLKLVSLAWVIWNLVSGKIFNAACWVGLLFALRSRPEFTSLEAPYHSAPYFLAATLLACRGIDLLWQRARRQPGAGRPAALAAFLAFLLLPTLIPTSLTAFSLKQFASEDPQYASLAASLKNCTGPEDRIAVFPFYPRFYLDSGRLPAVPNVFYLPWQEAWPPEREAVMLALARNAPKAVVVHDTSIRGRRWDDYGKDVNEWLKENYVSVARSASPGKALPIRLWLRRADAPAFVSCAQKL